MKKINKINIVVFLLCITLGFAQQTPAPKQTKDFAIVGATAHIGNGTVIKNSLIIVSKGKITRVLDNSKPNAVTMQAMDVIEAKGKHVYPGFIVSNGTLGLVEVDALSGIYKLT